MQGRGGAEGAEVGRFARADLVRVLDELGDDQRGREEGKRCPVRSAEQLDRRNAERGEAERDHGGVRGRRAHVFGYRYAGRFSFKAGRREAAQRGQATASMSATSIWARYRLRQLSVSPKAARRSPSTSGILGCSRPAWARALLQGQSSGSSTRPASTGLSA